MSVFFTVLTFLFIVVSVALVLVILVQRPQGGGLASAFGGGGGTDTAFGGRTGDALTVGTVSVFVLYLILAMSLNIFNPQSTLISDDAPNANTSANTGAIPTATMPAPEGSNAPATSIPVTPVNVPPMESSNPAVAPSGAPAIPATPAAPTMAEPAAAPALNPSTAPAPVPPVPTQNPKRT